MSTQGWDAYFKVIRFQPVHRRITTVSLGHVQDHGWDTTQPTGAALDLVRDDLLAVQYVMRKLFVEGGNGMVESVSTLKLGGHTAAETQAWFLHELRGGKKRVRLELLDYSGPGAFRTEGGESQLLSEVAHHLRSGTFVSFNLVSPIPGEITEALSMSRGLRTLTIDSWSHTEAGASLARALSSPTATHGISTIRTEISNPIPSLRSVVFCHLWDLLEVKPLKCLYLRLCDSARAEFFTQIVATQTHLRRRAQLGFPPLQTIELVCWHTLPPIDPIVAAIAKVSPTTVVKETLL